ncbi:MAG: SWIM zinc finger family protein [Thermoplasmata archaeon]
MVTEDDIKNRTEQGRFSRGIQYHLAGFVRDRVRKDGRLEATVMGSYRRSYRVTVSLTDDGHIQSTNCSCPDDHYGDCKHIVAVLLDWLEDKKSFKEVIPAKRYLEERSKEELILLINEMVKREPSLNKLLEEPLPGFSDADEKTEPVDPALYRHDVRDILDGFYGRKDEWEIVNSLQALVEKGKKHLEMGELGNAEAIFSTVIMETLDLIGEIYGQESEDIYDPLADAEDGLIECLKASRPDTEIRKRVVDSLYHMIKWDLDFGGIDIMYGPWDSLIKFTEKKDRDQLKEYLKEDIVAASDSEWKKKQSGALLLELYELDDGIEKFLVDLEVFDLPKLKALALLDMDKIDEANESAKKIDGQFDIVTVADRFRDKGYDDMARELVSSFIEKDPADRLKAWLIEFDKSRGEFERALGMEKERFRSSPSLSGFQRIMELAEELDITEKVRSDFFKELEKDKKFDIISEIFLDEGDLDRAWDYADRLGKNKRIWNRPWSLMERIVEAGVRSHPERAIGFYLKRAEGLVANRGRKNYRRAAEYLTQIKDIYRREGREGDWDVLIRSLRREFNNLPACMDEFDKAGL